MPFSGNKFSAPSVLRSEQRWALVKKYIFEALLFYQLVDTFYQTIDCWKKLNIFLHLVKEMLKSRCFVRIAVFQLFLSISFHCLFTVIFDCGSSADICGHFDVGCLEITRRECLKSALYLGLKKRKYFEPVKGGPFGLLKVQFVAKYQLSWRKDPLETKKNFLIF